MNRDEEYIINGSTVSSMVELLKMLMDGVETNKFLYTPSEYGYTIFAYEQTINELLSLEVSKKTKKQKKKDDVEAKKFLDRILKSLNTSGSQS